LLQSLVGVRRYRLATIATLIVGLSCRASAQTRPLSWNPPVDVTVTLGGAALWLTSRLTQGDIAPARCRVCGVDSLDAHVRTALVWKDPEVANIVSDLTAFVLTPVASVGLDAVAAGHDRSLGAIPEDMLLIGESVTLAADLTELTKIIVGRERPFVSVLPASEKPRTEIPSDNNASFFSGHASTAFALAASAGTISTLHGYRWAPLTWSIGGAIAVTTAYLRIAADKHWLTDVVVGAVVGVGIGFAVPYLFHPVDGGGTKSDGTSSVRALQAPSVNAVAFVW
jgi:membrane-associated phospholipid phosphatase